MWSRSAVLGRLKLGPRSSSWPVRQSVRGCSVFRGLPGLACCARASPLDCSRASVLASSLQRWGVVWRGRRARCHVLANLLVCSRAGHLRAQSQNYCSAIPTYYYIITTSLLHHYFGITWPLLLLLHYYKIIVQIDFSLLHIVKKLLPFHYYILLLDHYTIATWLLHNY